MNNDNKERKLTERERKRTEIVKSNIKPYLDQGYRTVDLTIDLVKINQMALIYISPLIVLFFLIWYLNHGFYYMMILDAVRSFPFILALLASVFLHEMIHGFVWGTLVNDHFKSIEFGITRATPYCTCVVPLSVASYLLGSLAPGLILGVMPCVLSVFLNDFNLFLLGAFQLLGAGGDFQISLKLIGYKSSAKNKLCMDHPTEIGLIILEK